MCQQLRHNNHVSHTIPYTIHNSNRRISIEPEIEIAFIISAEMRESETFYHTRKVCLFVLLPFRAHTLKYLFLHARDISEPQLVMGFSLSLSLS